MLHRIALIFFLLCAPAHAAEVARGFADPLLGRWDLTVEGPTGPYPSWLEVRLRTEHQIMARFVGPSGSVRHVGTIQYEDGQFEFTVPPQYEPREQDVRFEGVLTGDTLEGTTIGDDGQTLNFTGRRAPSLMERREATAWEEPISLLNGEDLNGWRMRSEDHAGCWTVEDGVLIATPPCIDLISEAEFTDFKLHVEFMYPPGSNSGVYLRGRHEVQIQDDAGKPLDPLRLGGVYGFIAPMMDAGLPANEWQTFDITLLGRRISVVLNGETIIDGQDVPGITGGALDSDEGAPGPILLQGDHGPIRYRNVTLTPAK